MSLKEDFVIYSAASTITAFGVSFAKAGTILGAQCFILGSIGAAIVCIALCILLRD